MCHKTHQGYMELVVDNIPALIKCIKPYPNLHDDLIELLTSFLMQTKSKKFQTGPQITEKLIKSVQFFAQVRNKLFALRFGLS